MLSFFFSHFEERYASTTFLNNKIRYNTLETKKSVLSRFPINTEKWVEKTRRGRVFFNRLTRVWTPDETLFRVFDEASPTLTDH